RHLPRDQEPGETDRPDETDHPPELAMPPFPPVDDLEFGEAHALIDALVLRYLAIEGEFPLPVLERERRQRAGHRPPFGDRQTGAGKPGEPADHDHRHHHHEENPDPDRDAAPGVHTSANRHRRFHPLLADLLEDAASLGHAAPPFAARSMPRHGKRQAWSSASLPAGSLDVERPEDSVKRADIGVREAHPPDQVAQIRLHALALDLREEEPDRVEPRLESL